MSPSCGLIAFVQGSHSLLRPNRLKLESNIQF